MLKINSIKNISESLITYDYSYSKEIKKYFTKDKFFVEYISMNTTKIPNHIKIIPFLANVAPISWFAGFDIQIEDVDECFYNSLMAVKEEFKKYYPTLVKDTQVKYNNLIKTEYSANKSAMLFSGGLDSFTTYFRHRNENLDLITIHGADIPIEDTKQWNKVLSYNENELIIAKNKKYYIKSNIRDFYSFDVDRLLPNLEWWGQIQHGLSLTATIAPLAFLNGYERIYIASSETRDTRKQGSKILLWGSMPETDNKIAWANTVVINDGELTRQEKIEAVVTVARNTQDKINLRVCYSENNENLNCSVCEKCIRTSFGIMIAGDNPNHYGFNVDASIYQRVKAFISNGFKSPGNQLIWKSILDYMLSNNNFFIFEQRDIERQRYEEIIKTLKVQTNSEIKKLTKYQKFKLDIMGRYPKLFNQYLILRKGTKK